MTKAYMAAPDVERIAESLIKTVPDHFPLDSARIEYLYVAPTPEHHGKVVLGRARRITGIPAYLAAGVRERELTEPAPLFVIEIAHEEWGRMDAEHRRALVDHELCHCTVQLAEDGQRKLTMVSHDVEEFRGVVERHGIWTPELADMFRAGADQLAMELDA